MKKFGFILCVLLSVTFAHAFAQAPAELVLKEGAQLTAKDGDMTLTIVAGKDMDRTYQWGECKLRSDMKPRLNRWFGSAGMYDPAGRMLLNPFTKKACQGISRTVVGEGQIHFRDGKAANKWVKEYIGRLPDFSSAVTADGLVLLWSHTPGRSQLNADLWQVCIQGKRPQNLAVGKNSSIEIFADSARVDCVTPPEKAYVQTQKMWADFWWENDEWQRCKAFEPQSKESTQCYIAYQKEKDARRATEDNSL